MNANANENDTNSDTMYDTDTNTRLRSDSREETVICPDYYFKMINMSEEEKKQGYYTRDAFLQFIFYHYVTATYKYDEDDPDSDLDLNNRMWDRYHRYKKECFKEQLEIMMKRAKERMALINQNNIIFETYIRRVMHPNKFALPLLQNEELNIDYYINTYVNTI